MTAVSPRIPPIDLETLERSAHEYGSAWCEFREILKARLDGMIFVSVADRRLRGRFHFLRDDANAEDFIADFLESARARMATGKYRDYDHELGDLEVFVAAGRMVVHRAKDFLRRLTRQTGETSDPERDAERAAPYLRLVDDGEVAMDMDRLVVEIKTPPTIPQQYGLLQLWPRLDRGDAAMFALWTQDVIDALSRTGAAENALRRLEDAHRSAGDAHAERVKQVLNKLDGARKPKRRERLEAAVDRLRVEHVLYPLDAAAIVGLLGVTVSNAHQIARRYRESTLRSMLSADPGVRQAFTSLLGDREQDGEDFDD